MTFAKAIIIAVVAALLVPAVALLVPAAIAGGDFEGFVLAGRTPTLSGCESACTFVPHSNASRGGVSCTDGGKTCTITFPQPAINMSAMGPLPPSQPTWRTPPACVLSTTATGGTRLAAPTTVNEFSFVVSGLGTYYYHCDGMFVP